MDGIEIRIEPRPGDPGAIAKLHGELYAAEFGFGMSFEAYVAEGVGELYRRYDPERDRVWLCERSGELVGSIALMHRDRGAAQLRYFLLAPACRGAGLGKRLLGLSLDFAREKGYRSVYLVTTADMAAAGSMYRRAGFRLVESKESADFGPPQVEQRYELVLF